MKTNYGPKWYQLPKTIRSLKKEPIGYISNLWKEFGDKVRIFNGLEVVHIFFHPDIVKHILLENHINYVKQTRDHEVLRFLFGNGLLASEGAYWVQQRQLMKNAFGMDQMPAFADCVIEKTTQMIQDWKRFEVGHQPFDVTAEMGRLTLQIAAKAFLGMDLQDRTQEVMQSVLELNVLLTEEASQLFSIPHFIPTAGNKKLQAAKKILDDTAAEAVENYRTGRNRTALLDALIGSNNMNANVPMRSLQDELITILLAGHETTANVLSWTWHLLARHPQVWQNLRSELRSLLENRLPTLQDSPRLIYTKMVLQESMRLYPPAWSLSRKAMGKDLINDYKVSSGNSVCVIPYLLHRHPQFWENPEEFRPERFAPGWESSQHRFAYLPFGAGPHTCIGKYFGMAEAQLILSAVAQSYQLDLCLPQKIELDPLITLRPKFGIQMKCKRIGEIQQLNNVSSI